MTIGSSAEASRRSQNYARSAGFSINQWIRAGWDGIDFHGRFPHEKRFHKNRNQRARGRKNIPMEAPVGFHRDRTVGEMTLV